jgi:phosphoglycolate phosphatase
LDGVSQCGVEVRRIFQAQKAIRKGRLLIFPDEHRILTVVKLVLFDIDGTLIRTGGAGVKAFEQTFAEVFELPAATKTLRFAGRTDVSLVRECFKLHRVETSEVNFQRFFDAYPGNLERLLGTLPAAILPGISAFLDQLVSVPDRPVLGLLTGNIQRGAELKLRHLGLWERFEMGAFADDNEDRNCIAAIAKERGEKMIGRRLRGEEIVVIGDTPHDITCAKSIGANALAVATGVHKQQELVLAEPRWAVEHIGQITVAEVLGRNGM